MDLPAVTTCQAVIQATQTSDSFGESAGQPFGWTLDDLKKAQEDDPEIEAAVRAFKQSSERPCTNDILLWTKQAEMLWYQWPRLTVKNELLYGSWNKNRT
jgi:hypothetical protein